MKALQSSGRGGATLGTVPSTAHWVPQGIPVMKRTVSHGGRLAAVLKATLLQMAVSGFEARNTGPDHEDRPWGRHISSGIQGCKFLDRKINE